MSRRPPSVALAMVLAMTWTACAGSGDDRGAAGTAGTVVDPETAATAPVTAHCSAATADAPAPAVGQVLDLFATTPVVAIGEHHGRQAEHEFLRRLVCDLRFPAVVDVVAVEFATSRRQATIDDYVGGATVSPAALAAVWQESTQRSGVWDQPMYRRFFELVREVNQGRSEQDRVRVLAGDPPIDWSLITSTGECDDRAPTCLDHWLQRREEHFADVVMSVEPQAGVLVIAGASHVVRRPDDDRPPSIPQRIDAAKPGSVSVILPYSGTHGASDPATAVLGSLVPPSLGLLHDPAWQAVTACSLFPDLVEQADGCASGAPAAAQLADAVLYLGPT